MSSESAAGRYAQALFESITEPRELATARQQLEPLGALLRQARELDLILGHPGISAEEKLGVLARISGKPWSALVRAFLQVVVEFGRGGDLDDILDEFEARVAHHEGRMEATVRSAHPLPQALLERLRQRLERREAKTITLTAELAPELLGGVQVLLGNRVIDASVRRRLSDLRQQLASVRVT
ncbi:MAG: ATP synthase F1 subunit delta [Candidatus Omnitrophica bacterium]|nr:ATP synthase F1 subunit delta [Candidatus Omnitrophota bacterium]